MRNSIIAQQKTRKTMKSRYGVEYPQQSKEIRAKVKKSVIEHYGVDNPMKNPDVAFKNSLKSLKVNEHVNHDYNIKLWKAKLKGKESDTCDILIDDIELDIIDSIDQEESYLKQVFPNYIYPWCSLDTVKTYINHTQTENANTALYLLHPEKGSKHLMNHSYDIPSLNKDHMYLGRVNGDDLYNVISITQTVDHVFYIDQMAPGLDLMPDLDEYIEFAKVYGIDIKYIQTAIYPDIDSLNNHHLKLNPEYNIKYVWYKDRERFFDDERTTARNKLVKEGWNVLKAYIYTINLI